MQNRRTDLLVLIGVLFMGLMALLMDPATAVAQGKPNILIIWGDDIGIDNVSLSSLNDGL